MNQRCNSCERIVHKCVCRNKLAKSEFNKATFVFEFTPDKFSGLESYQEDVRLLFQIAQRLGMNEGRRTMTVMYDNIIEEEYWESMW